MYFRDCGVLSIPEKVAMFQVKIPLIAKAFPKMSDLKWNTFSSVSGLRLAEIRNVVREQGDQVINNARC